MEVRKPCSSFLANRSTSKENVLPKKEGRVILLSHSHSQQRYFFLFSDLLLIVKEKARSTYCLKEKVPLCQLWLSEEGVEEIADDCNDKRCCFVIGWPTVNYVAKFSSANERDGWLATLKDSVFKEKCREYPKRLPVTVRFKSEDKYMMRKFVFCNFETTADIIRKAAAEFGVKDHKFYDLCLFPCKEANEYEFLRQLPEYLLMTSRFDDWMKAIDSGQTENEKCYEIAKLISELPQPNRTFLKHLICLCCHIVDHADVNHMDSQNLSICIGPSLLQPPLYFVSLEDLRSKKVAEITKFMIDNAVELFGEHCLHLFDDFMPASDSRLERQRYLDPFHDSVKKSCSISNLPVEERNGDRILNSSSSGRHLVSRSRDSGLCDMHTCRDEKLELHESAKTLSECDCSVDQLAKKCRVMSAASPVMNAESKAAAAKSACSSDSLTHSISAANSSSDGANCSPVEDDVTVRRRNFALHRERNPAFCSPVGNYFPCKYQTRKTAVKSTSLESAKERIDRLTGGLRDVSSGLRTAVRVSDSYFTVKSLLPADADPPHCVMRIPSNQQRTGSLTESRRYLQDSTRYFQSGVIRIIPTSSTVTSSAAVYAKSFNVLLRSDFAPSADSARRPYRTTHSGFTIPLKTVEKCLSLQKLPFDSEIVRTNPQHLDSNWLRNPSR
ncbi:unnamed protein product [Soboliphyme baturini]|uniref:Rho-GAP domain-containing protein n=1 Tax=Soboliphyme baturini TaxID=241478 RepID=A0A183IJR9_9BILA|nr:unnamed protein product [Soboliphyme baturini]